MHLWRKLVPFIIPIWKLCENILDACATFPRHRRNNRLGRWLFYQLMRAVAYTLSERLNRRICDPTSEAVWPLHAIRVPVSYFTSSLIYFLVEYAYCLIHIATLEQLLCPPVAVIVSGLRSTLLQLETMLDALLASEAGSEDGLYQPPTSTPKWEFVASMRPSDGDVSYFYAARISDYNLVDDPFWPSHASVLCVIEIRRQNGIWDTVEIWRVSLLNGGKKKLHEFSNRHRGNGGLLDRATCYQSAGVLFVHIWTPNRSDSTLLIYDVRYRKSVVANLKAAGSEPRKQTFSISCVHRFFHADGSTDGWQIQFLEYGLTRCYCHPEDDRKFRPRFEIYIFQIRGNRCRQVNHDGIVFGRCWNFRRFKRGRFVCTSGGSIGRYEEDMFSTDGPTLLYDHSSGTYSYFPNFDTLQRSDRPFAIYSTIPSPIGPSAGDKYRNLCPAILNNRECVECYENGDIFRREMASPTLKYAAAKALFHARPNLRSEMSAEEFRDLTGIGGMEGHFDR